MSFYGGVAVVRFNRVICWGFVLVVMVVVMTYGVILNRARKEVRFFKGKEKELGERVERRQGELVEKEGYLKRIEGDEGFREWVARKRLGLAEEGEVVFRFEKEKE